MQDTKNALSPFRAFVHQAHSLQAMIGRSAVAVVAPASPFVGLAPPWPAPTWIAAITAIIEVSLYVVCFEFLRRRGIERVRWWMKAGAWSLAASLFFYIILSVFFTPEAPDFLHREVAGLTYTPNAQLIMNANPGISDKELIKRFGNDVEAVYGSNSLKTMRAIFMFLWLLVFSSLVLTFTAFVISQEKGPKRQKQRAGG